MLKRKICHKKYNVRIQQTVNIYWMQIKWFVPLKFYDKAFVDHQKLQNKFVARTVHFWDKGI